MEKEEEEIAAVAAGNEQLDVVNVDELLRSGKGLRAPRWRQRAEAARFAAGVDWIGDGAPGIDACRNVLQQLVRQLALKDLNWQVRLAAVESAATILAATHKVLSADTFARSVWGVLATCLDSQPEVQLAASNCVLQQLLPTSFEKRHVIVEKLFDEFVAAATVTDALPSKFARLSSQPDVTTSLDNLPDGDMLLGAVTAGICLELLPLPTSGKLTAQGKQEIDRIPLLLTAASVSLEDANRRKSRMLAEALSKLLRCMGMPCYRESLLTMFNPKKSVFIIGTFLAGSYLKADVIDEDIADVLKTVKTVVLLRGLSLAFEASHLDNGWKNVVQSESPSLHQSKLARFSQGDVVALQQIVEMLKVPEDLTRTSNDEDIEVKVVEFIQSALPLLNISTNIIRDTNCDPEDVSIPPVLVENLLLCCATFAINEDEHAVATPWTLKALHDQSMALLTCLAGTLHATGALKVPKKGPQISLPLSLISEQIPSLLPRLKQVIQGSSGVTNRKAVYSQAPDGSVAASVLAAYQMLWLLTQLEHPHLDQHYKMVMPCALTALDHFSPEVKRHAMRSFIHLARHMSRKELQSYRDVILDAVSHSLIGCGDLWPVAVKMAVTTVICIEGKDPRAPGYRKILSEMIGELERQRDNEGFRIAWLQAIIPFMEAMGLVLVALFKNLLPLLFYWLHARDDRTCILTMTVLQTVILYTWPRIPFHAHRILKELVVVEKNSSNRKASSDIHAGVVTVYRLLNACSGPAIEEILLEDSDGNEVVSFIKTMNAEIGVEKKD